MAFVSPVPCESNTNALMSPGSIYSPSLELSPTFTQVSSYSPADSLSSPIPDFDNKMSLHLNETIDLFEHFIVVGAPPTVAHKFANKLKEVDDSSLSRRLMKTVGSLLSSSSKDKPSLSFTSPLPLKTPIKRNNDNNQNIINGDIGIETPSKHNIGKILMKFMNIRLILWLLYIEEVGRTGISSVFSRKPSFKTTSVAETPQPFDDAEPRTARLQDLSANESISLHTNIASSEATILFRYPQSVEPPPPEIIDFCLPVGAKIHHISGVDENISTIQEILYGHSQSKRTGRCFIFTLDDKTVTESERENTNTNYETGVGTGRLYGVCVIHSRLLAATESGNYSQSNSFEFESLVCYAFLTRFPFFDFFFQVIFDLITLERLERMEKLVSYLENDETEDVPINSKTSKDYHSMFSSDRRVYEYSPVDTLEKVLERLSSCKVPRYGEQMNFSVGSSLLPIEFKRFHLDYDQSLSEHEASAISWALPTLFSWMPIDLIVTTIGLLMCEVKVIIVGFEPGLISCAVFGLLELIKPLNWLTPMIPILPKKYLDFVESPVPILAGLVIDEFVLKDEVASKLDVFDVAKRHASEILKKSNDVENGGITAILNMQVKDIFVSSCHSHILQEVILPGINGLVNKLTASLPSFPLSSSIVGKTTTNVLNRNEDSTLQSPNSWTLGVASLRLNRTLFTPTIQQQLEVKQALCIMSDHIKGLCAMSNAFYKVDIKTSHKVTGIFETVTEVEESCDKEESEFFGREEELSKHENVLESSNTINSSINFTPKVMNCDDVILFSEHIIPYLSNDIDSLLGPRQFQLFIDRFIKTQVSFH